MYMSPYRSSHARPMILLLLATQSVSIPQFNDAGRIGVPEAPNPCSVAAFGAVPDNQTDNTEAFRNAAKTCAGGELLVPEGTWLTGPFNLSSNTVLRIEGTISGSQNPDAYPVVTQQPLDEAYRAPWMRNRQYQGLVSAYSATNITVTGFGTINGNGWPWWDNVTSQECNKHQPPSPNLTACLIQRPKLVEFVDCSDITLQGDSADKPITLINSPFWTFHPTFCDRVRVRFARFLAPRDHGNTDGVDPDSCSNVHVSDVFIDVGDDAVSVKSGLHWKTKKKIPAQNYLFERVKILFRNFAIGSDVSGDVRNITFRDSQIGDEFGSSPWAIKIKTDSQEGGIVDGVYFLNLTIGNITYCGSSSFVFRPPHSTKDHCSPRQSGATMFDVGMGYVGAPTNPGRVRNVVFDGVRGIGPTGNMMSARGQKSNPSGCPDCNEHIMNLTLRDIDLKQGLDWSCENVDGLVVSNVKPWSKESSCGQGH